MANPVILILGPPGAGKGTQSKLLADYLRGVHIASGDLIRQHDGSLADSEDFISSLDVALDAVAPNQPLILDGVGRKLGEANWLASKLRQLGRELKIVIFLNLEQSEAMERNSKRARVDDGITAQEHRWLLYGQETLPVLDFYRSSGSLIEVDGSGSVKAVFARIQELISAS